MAADDIDWRRLILQLLDEHDDTVAGERAAVLDFGHIHHRFTKESSTDA